MIGRTMTSWTRLDQKRTKQPSTGRLPTIAKGYRFDFGVCKDAHTYTKGGRSCCKGSTDDTTVHLRARTSHRSQLAYTRTRTHIHKSTHTHTHTHTHAHTRTHIRTHKHTHTHTHTHTRTHMRTHTHKDDRSDVTMFNSNKAYLNQRCSELLFWECSQYLLLQKHLCTRHAHKRTSQAL